LATLIFIGPEIPCPSVPRPMGAAGATQCRGVNGS
jgi:hypothetical protein